MLEEWRSVPGYEGLYIASNRGNIKGLKRNRVLKAAPNEKGYLYVVLYKDGAMKSHRVHRVIANTFLGEHKGLEVNHIDGNKFNNDVSNLEFCTHAENMKHAVSSNLINNQKPVIQMDSNKNVIHVFRTVVEAERETGAKCIARACRRGIKAAGFRWEYLKEGDYHY